jgi:hypothetical protein
MFYNIGPELTNRWSITVESPVRLSINHDCYLHWSRKKARHFDRKITAKLNVLAFRFSLSLSLFLTHSLSLLSLCSCVYILIFLACLCLPAFPFISFSLCPSVRLCSMRLLSICFSLMSVCLYICSSVSSLSASPFVCFICLSIYQCVRPSFRLLFPFVHLSVRLSCLPKS